MSVPLCSVHTIKVSARVSYAINTRRSSIILTLLLLISIVLHYPGLEQHALWLVLRLDVDARFILRNNVSAGRSSCAPARGDATAQGDMARDVH